MRDRTPNRSPTRRATRRRGIVPAAADLCHELGATASRFGLNGLAVRMLDTADALDELNERAQDARGALEGRR